MGHVRFALGGLVFLLHAFGPQRPLFFRQEEVDPGLASPLPDDQEIQTCLPLQRGHIEAAAGFRVAVNLVVHQQLQRRLAGRGQGSRTFTIDEEKESAQALHVPDEGAAAFAQLQFDAIEAGAPVRLAGVLLGDERLAVLELAVFPVRLRLQGRLVVGKKQIGLHLASPVPDENDLDALRPLSLAQEQVAARVPPVVVYLFGQEQLRRKVAGRGRGLLAIDEQRILARARHLPFEFGFGFAQAQLKAIAARRPADALRPDADDDGVAHHVGFGVVAILQRQRGGGAGRVHVDAYLLPPVSRQQQRQVAGLVGHLPHEKVAAGDGVFPNLAHGEQFGGG